MLDTTAVASMSERQQDRMEELTGTYPATRFDLCGQARFSCAVLVGYEDTNGAGEFWLTPGGRMIEPAPRPLELVWTDDGPVAA